jgi:hypothetical protein
VCGHYLDILLHFVSTIKVNVISVKCIVLATM